MIDQPVKLGILRHIESVKLRCVLPQRCGVLPQPGLVRRSRPVHRLLHELRARDQLHGHVLIRHNALAEIHQPRAEAVHPRFQRKEVGAKLLRREARLVPIVDPRFQRSFRPRVSTIRTMHEHAADDVVSVCEYVGLHGQGLTDHALGGKAPAVNFRLHTLDGYAPNEGIILDTPRCVDGTPPSYGFYPTNYESRAKLGTLQGAGGNDENAVACTPPQELQGY